MKTAKKILVFLALGYSLSAAAQGTTFNHSQERMEMIQYISAAAALPCQTYFETMHPSYTQLSRSWGIIPNQTTTAVVLSQQPALADSISKELEERAKIEGLNVADKKIDLSEASAAGKVQAALAKMQSAINSAASLAFTSDMRGYWEERMAMHASAFSETRKAYQPNSNRIEAMLSLCTDIMRDVQDIYGIAHYLNRSQKSKENKFYVFRPSSSKDNIVSDALKAGMSNWRASMTLASYKSTGSSSGDHGYTKANKN